MGTIMKETVTIPPGYHEGSSMTGVPIPDYPIISKDIGKFFLTAGLFKRHDDQDPESDRNASEIWVQIWVEEPDTGKWTTSEDHGARILNWRGNDPRNQKDAAPFVWKKLLAMCKSVERTLGRVSDLEEFKMRSDYIFESGSGVLEMDLNNTVNHIVNRLLEEGSGVQDLVREINDLKVKDEDEVFNSYEGTSVKELEKILAGHMNPVEATYNTMGLWTVGGPAMRLEDILGINHTEFRLTDEEAAKVYWKEMIEPELNMVLTRMKAGEVPNEGGQDRLRSSYLNGLYLLGAPEEFLSYVGLVGNWEQNNYTSYSSGGYSSEVDFVPSGSSSQFTTELSMSSGDSSFLEKQSVTVTITKGSVDGNPALRTELPDGRWAVVEKVPWLSRSR